jgi:hypothetical protein
MFLMLMLLLLMLGYSYRASCSRSRSRARAKHFFLENNQDLVLTVMYCTLYGAGGYSVSRYVRGKEGGRLDAVFDVRNDAISAAMVTSSLAINRRTPL